jgi:hypothetical protein
MKERYKANILYEIGLGKLKLTAYSCPCLKHS